MRLALPDPRAALGLVDELASALPRLLGLLASAEQTLSRVEALLDRIESTRAAADVVIEQTDAIVTEANALIVRTAGTIGSIEPTLERTQRLADRLVPSLEVLQPTLERLARSTSPEEVEAVIRLIDHLPDLVDKTLADILPIVENMKSVAPDIHDLLDTVQELNEMIAKIPGMGRIKRRVDERQAADADD